MKTYTVYFSASFCDTIEVEAEDEDDAASVARAEIESTFSVYGGSYTSPFDDVTIDEVQEED